MAGERACPGSKNAGGLALGSAFFGIENILFDVTDSFDGSWINYGEHFVLPFHMGLVLVFGFVLGAYRLEHVFPPMPRKACPPLLLSRACLLGLTLVLLFSGLAFQGPMLARFALHVHSPKLLATGIILMGQDYTHRNAFISETEHTKLVRFLINTNLDTLNAFSTRSDVTCTNAGFKELGCLALDMAFNEGNQDAARVLFTNLDNPDFPSAKDFFVTPYHPEMHSNIIPKKIAFFLDAGYFLSSASDHLLISYIFDHYIEGLTPKQEDELLDIFLAHNAIDMECLGKIERFHPERMEKVAERLKLLLETGTVIPERMWPKGPDNICSPTRIPQQASNG